MPLQGAKSILLYPVRHLYERLGSDGATGRSSSRINWRRAIGTTF